MNTNYFINVEEIVRLHRDNERLREYDRHKEQTFGQEIDRLKEDCAVKDQEIAKLRKNYSELAEKSVADLTSKNFEIYELREISKARHEELSNRDREIAKLREVCRARDQEIERQAGVIRRLCDAEPKPDYVTKGAPWRWAMNGLGQKVAICYRSNPRRIQIQGFYSWYPQHTKNSCGWGTIPELSSELFDECKRFWDDVHS